MTKMNIDGRIAARLELVDEHIEFENQHNLNGIMRTFGVTARYDDDAWDAHYSGRDQVLTYYEGLLQALPGRQTALFGRVNGFGRQDRLNENRFFALWKHVEREAL